MVATIENLITVFKGNTVSRIASADVIYNILNILDLLYNINYIILFNLIT